MTTQTIFNTAPTSNFTQLHNGLLESAIPPKPKSVLFYLLSKPSSWRLRVADLKNRLGLSTYGVRQALQWLQMAGYLYYERSKSGHTTWFVHNTPQTRVVEPHVEIPHVENQPDLVIPRQIVIQENNYTAPISQNVGGGNVVVLEADASTEPPPLPLPDSLKGSQAKAARKLLNNVTVEQAAMVLLIFNQAMQSKKVGNPVGYLHALVKASQNGTLTASEAPQKLTLNERLQKQKAEQEAQNKRLKVDNDSHFAKLKAMFGSDGRKCPV